MVVESTPRSMVGHRGNESGGDAAPVDSKHGKGNADEGKANHLGVRRQAERAAVRDRSQVVDEAKNAGCQRGEQHKHELGGELSHQKAGQRNGNQDDDATHGGPALLNQVTLGAIGANLLADALDLQELNPPRHKQHRDDGGDAQSQKCLVRRIRRIAEHGLAHTFHKAIELNEA